MMLSVALLYLVCQSVFIADVTSSPLLFKMLQTEIDAAYDVTPADVQIVTRSEWGARAAKPGISKLRTPVPFVVVHHTDGSSCHDQAACSRIVRGIQNYHMDERHWSDIGYNFLVGEDGRVYEGRGWDNEGAQAKGFNAQSVGIAFLGTYSAKAPNAAALTALKQLITIGVQRNKVSGSYTLVGHRQTNHVGYTECPGDALMCVIMKWPHWKPYQKVGKFVPPKC